MNDLNLIETTDSYKVSHYRQYPPGTEIVYSFFESRGGIFSEVTFFGLQYILKRYLVGEVFNQADIDEAARNFAAHFGDESLFNRAGWERLLQKHGGNLPLLIKAVPEGATVPVGNVLMTIENTDLEFPWLTNWLETLLVQVWYPCTVATQSREMRKVVLRYLEETGDPCLIDFKLHDFGFRGSTSVESAGIGGAAHLVNFKGTDTIQALRVAHKYYSEPMAGFSIPAAEHSTITAWGKENEVDAYRNMLEQFPSGLVACVSDSYDIFNACKNLWGEKLREQVLARDGCLVVRPDSGDPPSVVVEVLETLRNAFGCDLNDRGYKVLNPKVRVIQGDGIDYKMLERILFNMKIFGWSADNIAFGSGGGLLQKVNRDTQRFAFKCSAVRVNGEWRDVIKTPVTDPGKNSKAGRLMLCLDDKHGYATIREEIANECGFNDEMVTVFKDGELLTDWSFAEVRERAACVTNQEATHA
jgi:nicotinamide phosphoribosyltransferase